MSEDTTPQADVPRSGQADCSWALALFAIGWTFISGSGAFVSCFNGHWCDATIWLFLMSAFAAWYVVIRIPNAAGHGCSQSEHPLHSLDGRREATDSNE